MQPAAPTIHPLQPEDDASAFMTQLAVTPRAGAEREPGIYVLVHVSDAGNVGSARVEHAPHSGTVLERWLRHERRGASPGGWSEQHHPRSEQAIGAWKDASAAQLDRLLIDLCRQAWRLEQEAPYVVEHGVLTFEACGVDQPPSAS